MADHLSGPRAVPIISSSSSSVPGMATTSPRTITRQAYTLALLGSALLCLTSIHALSSYAPPHFGASHDELFYSPGLSNQARQASAAGPSWNSLASALGGFTTSFVHAPALNVSWLARPAGFGPHITADLNYDNATDTAGIAGVVESIATYALRDNLSREPGQSDSDTAKRGCNIDAKALIHAHQQQWAHLPVADVDEVTTAKKGTTSRIALIQRGECSFVIKLLNAQALGFDAAIVYNDALHAKSPSPGAALEPIPRAPASADYDDAPSDEDELISMWSPLREAARVRIPSVFISHASGNTIENLLRLAQADNREFTLVLEPEDGPHVFFLDLVIVMFFLPTVFTFVILITSRLRRIRYRRKMRAPQAMVDTLPIFKWSEDLLDTDIEAVGAGEKVTQGEMKLARPEQAHTDDVPSASRFSPLSAVSRILALRLPSRATTRQQNRRTKRKTAVIPQGAQNLAHKIFSQRECAICLSDFANGEEVRLLPCGHLYHVAEIDAWLTKQRRWCPVCRCAIDAADEQSEPTQDADVDDAVPADADVSTAAPAAAQPIITREDIDAAVDYIPVASSSTARSDERTPLLRRN